MLLSFYSSSTFSIAIRKREKEEKKPQGMIKMEKTQKVILKCEGENCTFESDFEGDFGVIDNKLLCYDCASKPNSNDPLKFSLLERKEYENTKNSNDWFIIAFQ